MICNRNVKALFGVLNELAVPIQRFRNIHPEVL
jgi:hypothetical protein